MQNLSKTHANMVLFLSLEKLITYLQDSVIFEL